MNTQPVLSHSKRGLTLSTLRKRFRRFGGSNIDLSLPNNERNLSGKSGSCRSPSQITTAFNVPSLSSAILCVHLSNEFEMIMDFCTSFLNTQLSVRLKSSSQPENSSSLDFCLFIFCFQCTISFKLDT